MHNLETTSKVDQLQGFKALDSNPYFRHLMKQVRDETERSKSQFYLSPSPDNNLGFLLSQQQAIGEARMGEKLERMLQSTITTLTEELKPNENPE